MFLITFALKGRKSIILYNLKISLRINCIVSIIFILAFFFLTEQISYRMRSHLAPVTGLQLSCLRSTVTEACDEELIFKIIYLVFFFQPVIGSYVNSFMALLFNCEQSTFIMLIES